MAQQRAHEVDAWLAKPGGRFPVVLIYGPDRGLVSERARVFALGTGIDLADPFSVIRFEGADIESDPGRLMDEAGTVSMFGGQRLIWIRNASGGKDFVARMGDLAADPPPDVIVLVEAGDLKKGASLRSMVEKSQHGMALPCYADEARDLDGLIDGELSAAGLRISQSAKGALRQHLGGDRLATRGELLKLILYCHGRQSVELEDVVALIPDVSATSADEVVEALLSGRVDAIDGTFARALNAGSQPYPVLAAAMRQIQTVEQLRAAIEQNGGSASSAVASARPPIFFKRRAAVEKAVASMTGELLRRLLSRLQAGVLQARERPELDITLSRATLLAVGTEIAQAYARPLR